MTTSSTITWLPAAWCDEIVPSDLLKAPNHYLELQPDMSWQLCFPSDHYEAGNASYRMPIENGQIIEWISNEYLGHRNLSVKSDGTYKLDSEFPSHATIFWLPEESECAGDTLKELVATIREHNDQEGGEYTVAASWWSAVCSKRLEIREGHPVRFVDCAGAS